MPLAEWSLYADRPIVQVALAFAAGGDDLVRRLVADTGAGSRRDVFELILDEDDCLQCGGIPIHQVRLSGAYRGLFPVSGAARVWPRAATKWSFHVAKAVSKQSNIATCIALEPQKPVVLHTRSTSMDQCTFDLPK